MISLQRSITAKASVKIDRVQCAFFYLNVRSGRIKISDLEKFTMLNIGRYAFTKSLEIGDGIYVWTNTSTQSKPSVLSRLFKLYDEDPADLVFYLRDENEANSKVPKHQSTAVFGALDDALAHKIIEILREEPNISQEVIGERLGRTRRVIQKKIKLLKEAGLIERVGGKRYGHWIIHE